MSCIIAAVFTHRSFDLVVESRAGNTTIVVDGELDLATVPELDLAIRQAEMNGVRSLVLDLTRLAFCDSSGVHMICEARDRAHEQGMRLTVRANPAVRRVFGLCGVHDLTLHVLPGGATAAA